MKQITNSGGNDSVYYAYAISLINLMKYLNDSVFTTHIYNQLMLSIISLGL